jgi:hypothetical protein
MIKASSDPSDSSVVGVNVAMSIGHKFDPVSLGYSTARHRLTAAAKCRWQLLARTTRKIALPRCIQC